MDEKNISTDFGNFNYTGAINAVTDQLLKLQKELHEKVLQQLLQREPTSEELDQIERGYNIQTINAFGYQLLYQGHELGSVTFKLEGTTWTVTFHPSLPLSANQNNL